MPQISVIVPVYNAEKTLHRCVDSILAQTFTDFELLLIDDGSTDKSGLIVDEYAEKDSRVRAFHKENEGASSARNVGIQQAVGEYSIFLDADDFYCNDEALALLFQNARDNEADIVRGEYKSVNKDGLDLCQPLHSKKREQRKKYIGKIVEADDFYINVLVGEYYFGTMLIRTPIIKKYQYPYEMVFLEDMYLLTLICQQKLRCLYIPFVFYAYRKYQTSASNRKGVKQFSNSFGMCAFYEGISESCESILMRNYCRYCSVMMYYWTSDSLAQEYSPQEWKNCKEQFSLGRLHGETKKRIRKWRLYSAKSLFVLHMNFSMMMWAFWVKAKYIHYKYLLKKIIGWNARQ